MDAAGVDSAPPTSTTVSPFLPPPSAQRRRCDAQRRRIRRRSPRCRVDELLEGSALCGSPLSLLSDPGVGILALTQFDHFTLQRFEPLAVCGTFGKLAIRQVLEAANDRCLEIGQRDSRRPRSRTGAQSCDGSPRAQPRAPSRCSSELSRRADPSKVSARRSASSWLPSPSVSSSCSRSAPAWRSNSRAHVVHVGRCLLGVEDACADLDRLAHGLATPADRTASGRGRPLRRAHR